MTPASSVDEAAEAESASTEELATWAYSGDSGRSSLPVPHIHWFDLVVVVVLSSILGISYNLSNPRGIALMPKTWNEEAIPTIAPKEAHRKYTSGPTLLVDARPSRMFQQEHIEGAISLPVSSFDIFFPATLDPVPREKEIVVYGSTISRLYDDDLARKLELRGFENVSLLSGGLKAWKNNGYSTAP